MSVGDDLQHLADACQTGAHQDLDALIALGPRPTTSPADLAWDHLTARLRSQSNQLSAMAGNIAAQAVIAGLAVYRQEAQQLGAVTADANVKIGQIAEVSKRLTTLSRVLDVGLAVLALAAAPSPDEAIALVDRIDALAAALKVYAPTPTPTDPA